MPLLLDPRIYGDKNTSLQERLERFKQLYPEQWKKVVAPAIAPVMDKLVQEQAPPQEQQQEPGYIESAVKGLAKGLYHAYGSLAEDVGTLVPPLKPLTERMAKSYEAAAQSLELPETKSAAKNFLNRLSQSAGYMLEKIPEALAIGSTVKAATASTRIAKWLGDMSDFVVGSMAQGAVKGAREEGVPGAVKGAVEQGVYARLYEGPSMALQPEAAMKRALRPVYKKIAADAARFTGVGVGQTVYEAAKQGRAPTEDELKQSIADSLGMFAAFQIMPVISKLSGKGKEKLEIARIRKKLNEAIKKGNVEQVKAVLDDFFENPKVSDDTKEKVAVTVEKAKQAAVEPEPEEARPDEQLQQMAEKRGVDLAQWEAERQAQPSAWAEEKAAYPERQATRVKPVYEQPIKPQFVPRETIAKAEQEAEQVAKFGRLPRGEVINVSPAAPEREEPRLITPRETFLERAKRRGGGKPGVEEKVQPAVPEEPTIWTPRTMGPREVIRFAEQEREAGPIHEGMTKPEVQEVPGKEGQGMPTGRGVQGIRRGGQEAETIEEVTTKSGKPFKIKGALVLQLRKRGLLDTHEPVKVDEGWIGKPKETALPRMEAAPGAVEKEAGPAKSEISLQDKIQIVKDQIATRKANKQKVPQHLYDKLNEWTALLEGREKPGESVVSLEVFGHPSATNIRSEKYGNLIPIKVKDKATVEKRINKTQKLIDELQAKLGKNKKLSVEEETILGLLKNETMPELNRLWKQLEKTPEQAPKKEAVQSKQPKTEPQKPTPKQAEAKQPWEMTRGEFEAEYWKARKRLFPVRDVPAKRAILDKLFHESSHYRNKIEWTLEEIQQAKLDLKKGRQTKAKKAAIDLLEKIAPSPENMRKEFISRALKENKLTPEQYNKLHAKDYGEYGSEEFKRNFPDVEVKGKERIKKETKIKEKKSKPIKPKKTDLKKVARFRELANNLQKQIDEKRNPAISQLRLTPRRARIAAGMAQDAEHLEHIQAKLYALADAIENKILPSSLSGITNKAQVEALLRWQDFPKFNARNLHAVQDNKRLVKAGIDNDNKFQQAKRDLLALGKSKKKTPEEIRTEKIKKAELELVGKNVGVDFFPTPKPIIEKMLNIAEIKPGMSVLEPSAGKGDIADSIKEKYKKVKLKTVEISSALNDLLKLKGYDVEQGDFLKHKGQYDRIIMNPPFSKGQDIDHVRYAYDLLKPHGRLVAIMSEGPFFRSDKKAKAFREWLKKVGGTSEKLPSKSFTGKEAFRQTGASSRLVVIDKLTKKPTGIKQYSLGERPEKPLTKPLVDLMVKKASAKWKETPGITVVEKQSDLPKEVQRPEPIKGVFYKGKVYLVAENLASHKDVVKTLTEEVIGHAGLRKALDSKLYDQTLDTLWNKHKDDILPIAKDYKLDVTKPEQRRQAVDEWIAKQIADDSLPKRIWQRLVFAVKAFARKLGYSGNFTLNEIKGMLRAGVNRKYGSPVEGEKRFALGKAADTEQLKEAAEVIKETEKEPEAPESIKPFMEKVKDSKAKDFLAKTKNALLEAFAPELLHEKGKEAEAKASELVAKELHAVNVIKNALYERKLWWDKLPESARLKYIISFEEGDNKALMELAGGNKKVYETLQAIKAEHRDLYNKIYEAEKKAGIELNYIKDYWVHLWKDPDKAARVFRQFRETMGKDPFTRSRILDTIRQGLELGLELKTTNPEEMVIARINSGLRAITRQKFMDWLVENGLAEPYKKGTKLTKEFDTIVKMPDGKTYMVSKARAEKLEKMSDAGKRVYLKNLIKNGYIKPYEKGTDVAGKKVIDAPNGKAYAVEKEIVPLMENAGLKLEGPKSLWVKDTPAGMSYRTLMRAKNMFIPIKLGMSLFHATHIGTIMMPAVRTGIILDALEGGKSWGEAIKELAKVSTGLTQIKEVKEGLRLGKLLDKPLSELSPADRQAVQYILEGGFTTQMPHEWKVEAKEAFDKALASKNVAGILGHGVRRVVELSGSWLFEYYIPALKRVAYLKRVRDLMARRPELADKPNERLKEFTKIRKSIDNQFGEMTYKTLFWKPILKDVGIGSMLSMGWQLGFVREYGGAAVDTARFFKELAKKVAKKEGKPEITGRMVFVLDYTIQSLLLGGLLTWALTGSMPQKLIDYIYPRTGDQEPDGTPTRLNTPYYTREFGAIAQHIKTEGPATGMLHMFRNKANPMIAPILRLWSNKDFYGTDIRDPHAPILTQTKQFFEYLAGEAAPISLSSAKRGAETMGWAKSLLLSEIGFTKAPAYARLTPLQSKIFKYYSEYKDKRMTRDEAERSRIKRKMRVEWLTTGKISDETWKEAFDKDVFLAAKPSQVKANITTFIKSLRLSSDVRAFAGLPADIQVALLKEMNEQELKKFLPHAKGIAKIRYYRSKQKKGGKE